MALSYNSVYTADGSVISYADMNTRASVNIEGYIRYNQSNGMMEVYQNGNWDALGFVDQVESLAERHARVCKELAKYWPEAYFDLGMKGLL